MERNKRSQNRSQNGSSNGHSKGQPNQPTLTAPALLRTLLGNEIFDKFSRKQVKWIIISVVAAFTVLWYTTPLASLTSGLVIDTMVPRYLDVELGTYIYRVI